MLLFIAALISFDRYRCKLFFIPADSSPSVTGDKMLLFLAFVLSCSNLIVLEGMTPFSKRIGRDVLGIEHIDNKTLLNMMAFERNLVVYTCKRERILDLSKEALGVLPNKPCLSVLRVRVSLMGRKCQVQKHRQQFCLLPQV
ncbi:unnamed protein product [Protopolystoma xenopodis]|uniref:Uncharacterized protein n=1 Tax=Protopolystoma xenopodis TaxID=117903 RepID=A0A3S5ALW9_9PLAT|nr:unnamed protein product [Protopolystoma xenopodis]